MVKSRPLPLGKVPNKMAAYESNVVNVVEIAFGPDTDPKAKISTALYFDIPHQCIQKRNANRSGTSPLAMMTVDVYLGTATNQPFYLTRPYDDDALALTRGILEHRLEMIDLPKWEEDAKELYVFSDSTKIEKIRAHISSVEMIELGLRSRFECLLRHWGVAFWGRCAERFDSTDAGATVLHVNGNYNPLSNYHRGTGEARSVRLWNSFVSVVRVAVVYVHVFCDILLLPLSFCCSIAGSLFILTHAYESMSRRSLF